MKTLIAKIQAFYAARPAVVHAIGAGIVSILVALGARFGLNFTGDQVAAAWAIIAPVLSVGAGLLTEQKVTPYPPATPLAPVPEIPTVGVETPGATGADAVGKP